MRSQKRPGIAKIMLKMNTGNRRVSQWLPWCHFGCIFHHFAWHLLMDLGLILMFFSTFQSIVLDASFIICSTAVNRFWYTSAVSSNTLCCRISPLEAFLGSR